MVQLSYTGQQLDQAIKKVRADADIYTILNGTKFGTGTAAYYSITATASHLTADPSNPVQIYEDSSVTLVFTADGLTYKTPTSVSVTNASSIYVRSSNTRCSVVISNPTGNVSVSISGVAISTTSFSIVQNGNTDSCTCETGMSWNEYRTSGMPGSQYVTISGTDVLYKGLKVFTSSSYTTAVTATSTITATTYYATDTSLLLSGTWLFADYISWSTDFSANVAFTSGGFTFTEMTGNLDMLYYTSNRDVLVYYGAGEDMPIGWQGDEFRTITFIGATPVTAEFKAFIVANAVQL